MGTMYVKGDGTVGDGKVYVCLFTCASTWTIHLEVVSDLTEVTFLHVV